MIRYAGSGAVALNRGSECPTRERVQPRPRLAKPSISILFVDDRDREAARIESALAACRDFDVDVDHVCDPGEAWRLWEERIHDLALFDIWLGNGTSIGLLAQLGQDPATRPIVVLTSLPDAEARSFASGAGDFLVHSKDDLSSAALALTLGSALALSRRMAITLDA